MKMTPVKSSNIESIGYDADKKQLNVTFKSGKTFGYNHIGQKKFDDIMGADSVGSFFNRFVKSVRKGFEILDADVVEIEFSRPTPVVDYVSSLKIDIAFMKKQFLLIEQLALQNSNAKAILAVTRETLSTLKDDDNA